MGRVCGAKRGGDGHLDLHPRGAVAHGEQREILAGSCRVAADVPGAVSMQNMRQFQRA
jgi:hypothetical protein